MGLFIVQKGMNSSHLLRLIFVFAFVLPASSKAQSLAVVSASHVIYAGVPSPVVYVTKERIASVNVEGAKVLSENVLNDYATELLLQTESEGQSVVVDGIGLDGGALGPCEFIVLSMPNPETLFGPFNEAKDTLSRIDLKQVDEVGARLDERLDLDVLEVQGFDLVISESGILRMYRSESNQLTEEMRARLNHLTSGSIVYVEDVRVKPSGSDREVYSRPLKFYID